MAELTNKQVAVLAASRIVAERQDKRFTSTAVAAAETIEIARTLDVYMTVGH